MFRFLYHWFLSRRKNKSIKRIEAYRELPGLLSDIHKLHIKAAEELVTNPPYPPEEMKRRLANVAKVTITKCFPEIIPDIKKIEKEMDISEDEAYVFTMATVILPEQMRVMEKELEQNMKDIEELCAEGVDEELGKLG